MNYSWETLFGQFEHKNKGKNHPLLCLADSPTYETYLSLFFCKADDAATQTHRSTGKW